MAANRGIALDGGAILPGFQDAHNHVCFAGRYRLTRDLHELPTREGYLDAVARYARANPHWSTIHVSRGVEAISTLR